MATKKTEVSLAEARAVAGKQQRLSADTVAQAAAAAHILGRAQPADIGDTHPVRETQAVQAPGQDPFAKIVHVPAPTQKGIKLTVELPEDVWKALKTYCTDNRTSGQKVMAALIMNFLKNQA